MARKTITVTMKADSGRDAGKAFFLTEMPAAKAEKWAIKALGAMVRANVDLPEDVASLGMAGMAFVGFQALSRVPFVESEPLLDEMMECVEIIPDPARPDAKRRLYPVDVEEVATFGRLRLEAFKLHVDFLQAGVAREQTPAPQTAG